MSNYRYFSDDEVKGLDGELCAKLDMARDKAGVPFIITSGLRTAQNNAALAGAVSDSSHLTGHAVDIATGDDHTFNRVLFGLTSAGLDSRMGIYYKLVNGRVVWHHVHVDNDATKTQQVTWGLVEENAC